MSDESEADARMRAWGGQTGSTSVTFEFRNVPSEVLKIVYGMQERNRGYADPECQERLDRILGADLEAACIVLHDAYEAAAQRNGWDTQARSRKPWEVVPEENKQTMRDAVRALIEWMGNR